MFVEVLSMILFISTTSGTESFSEELFLDHLPSGHLYSLFQFTNSWNVNLFDDRLPLHFNLFPKSFAEIIEKFHVLELHLSLTQGRWQYSKWGYPIITAPTGVELWVWFHPDLDKKSVDIHWNGLVNALSGQFCSSLNFINKDSTSSPNFSFKPQGVWPNDLNTTVHLRHATLPKETVCTENLTPWKKLLPCGSEAGLAMLLNAGRLFDSSYHSLAVHLRSVCEGECDDVTLELKQTLSSVFDPEHASLNKGWSLKQIFGSKLQSICPLASHSNLIVDLDEEIKENMFPLPNLIKTVKIGETEFQRAIFDLKQIDFTNEFELVVKSNLRNRNGINLPYLTAHKYATGFGLEMGGIFCIIKNTHMTESFYLMYLDVIPYFLRVYFNTLKVEVNNIIIRPDRLKFTPANMREQPTSMEFMVLLPPQSTLTIEYEYEKVFLDWLQHPPDSHHGYYVSSSIISGNFPDSSNSSGISELCSKITSLEQCNRGTDLLFRRIYTESLLIPVPLPDFSMPYNVICLTCTVIAIAFGSIFNITTRTFQVDDKNPPKKMLDKLKCIFSKIFSKGNDAP